MSSYRLREDLSFCLVDGQPIFLDIDKDRYFRLSGTTESTFLAYIEGNVCSSQGIKSLLDQDILSKAERRAVAMATAQPALVSVLERPPAKQRCGILTVAEVLATVYWTRRQLRTHGLKATLERALGRQSKPAMPQSEDDQARIVDFATTFLRARRFVSIPTRCLLDSLSMARFLRRRHIRADIVFGVTGNPFTAHCWIQAGNIVLNDTVGNTRMYSVIKVA